MNYNKVFLLGNLTRDPELRQTPSGQSVASFGLATNRFYTDSAGQKQQQTEFHNVVAWGKLAEICNQYLAKGRLAFIEGRLQTRSWQDQQGVKKYRTEVITESMQMGPRLAGDASPQEKTQENAVPASSPDIPVINYPDEGDEIQVKDIPF